MGGKCLPLIIAMVVYLMVPLKHESVAGGHPMSLLSPAYAANKLPPPSKIKRPKVNKKAPAKKPAFKKKPQKKKVAKKPLSTSQKTLKPKNKLKQTGKPSTKKADSKQLKPKKTIPKKELTKSLRQKSRSHKDPPKKSLKPQKKKTDNKKSAKKPEKENKKERLKTLTKKLKGPTLSARVAATFKNGAYSNRKLGKEENFYKYHGVDNRTGKKISWLTNKKYTSESQLRKELAIRKDWGVKINRVSTFRVPKGTWISEGKAAAQGKKYPGGGYQAVISNLPRSWVVRTDKAFKT